MKVHRCSFSESENLEKECLAQITHTCVFSVQLKLKFYFHKRWASGNLFRLPLPPSLISRLDNRLLSWNSVASDVTFASFFFVFPYVNYLKRITERYTSSFRSFFFF